MYATLTAEMARRQIDKKMLSNLTGIKYSTLLNKFTGRSEWTKSDMCQIKQVVAPNMTMDQLFKDE